MCNKIMALTGSDKRELYIDPSNKLNSYANLWRKEQNHSKEYIFSLEGDYTNGARYHGVTFVNAGWGLYNTWGISRLARICGMRSKRATSAAT
ncbi:MAG: hypothetical protein ACLRMJ_03560 [Alistipes finegoldii]